MAQSKDPPAEVDKPEVGKNEPSKEEDDKKTFQEKEEELSEEDLKLKESLEAFVQRLSDPKHVATAIDSIGKEIRTSTTSMTSVPKPLKFLRPHFDAIKVTYQEVSKDSKASLADVLSVLATVSGKEDDREALHFRLAGTGGDPGEWGHEYMRHLAGEIAAEYNQRNIDSKPVDDLMGLVKVIVPHYMKHNSETEAVDLLLEVDDIDLLMDYIDDKNYQRTCLYLTSAAAFLPEPDDTAVLHTAYCAYKKVKKWHDAMRVALRLNDQSYIEEIFSTCPDPIDKQQMAYLLARHGTMLDCEEGACSIADEELREKVTEIMSNTKLSEKFLILARDLDVMEPKLPEDIYKMHLIDQRPGGLGNVDSAMKNLSATLVNALLNVGFGIDKLMMTTPEANEKQWIFRNKDQGKLCATASLGAINMWEVDTGLPQLDKYTYSEDQHVVAGACLGFGLCFCSIRSDLDPAYALLFEHVNDGSAWVKIGAVMGMGLSYAGTCKSEVQGLLIPIITNPDSPMDLVGHAALALGLTYAATCEQDCVEAILQALMMLPEAKLSDPFLKFILLGLGMLFLGKQETVEPTLEVAKSLHEQISKYAIVVLDTCAYAGSGNVLKVQEMLALCGEHDEEEEGKEWQTAHLGPATIGIGLIAMGEDLGASMACRVLEHLLQYGDPKVRQAVPLALALLNLSNPDVYTMDTLSRLSHDQDGSVTKSAILAFGFLGAGTNNARLAGLLRNLSAYYTKDPQNLHVVRLAQGMLHLGKGLVTITPFHTDRQLMSQVSLAGILATMYCGLDMSTTLCGKHAFMLFYLAPAMKPRFLLTIDESGNNIPVPVRVGEAVDTVAQAGQPKGITGFQTHNTPVLLAVRDRAELATEKYVAVSPLLEGVVIVRPNPDYVEGEP